MTIEMLWAQDDPAEVLRDRFGFSSAEGGERLVGSTVERHWGNSCRGPGAGRDQRQQRPCMGEQRGPTLLLKWSVAPERFERLALAATVTACSARSHFPVSARCRHSLVRSM